MRRVRTLIASLVWLSTAAPGSTQPAADDTAAITIEVGPRWGASEPGAWTPYVISLKNQGSADVAGVVRLVPNPIPPLPPGPDRRRPALPPWPVYELPVTLGAGDTKSLDVIVLEAPERYRAELRSGDHDLIAEARFATPETGTHVGPKAVVALMTKVAGGDARLEAVSTGFGSTLMVTAVGVSGFPEGALGLSGLNAVVIDDFDTAALAPAQVTALRDFVASGGGLVLGGGAGWARTIGSLPDELVPLRPTGTATASLGALGGLGGVSTQASAIVAVGDLRRGRVVLESIEGTSLAVESEHGLGRVVQLTYDPLAEPFASDPELGGIAWDHALVRATSTVRATIPLVVAEPWEPDVERAPWRSWPVGTSVTLGLYLLIAGPACYVMVRRHRRQGRGWLALPLAAVVLGGASAVATSSSGTRPQPADQLVQARIGNSDGTWSVNTLQVVNAASGDGGGKRAELAVPTGAPASTVVGPFPTLLSDNGPAGHWSVYPSQGGGLLRTGAEEADLGRPVASEARTVQSVLLDRAPAKVTAELRLEQRGGYPWMTGRVTNQTEHQLHNLVAQVPRPSGFQARIAETVEPGATVTVDTQVWAAQDPYRDSDGKAAAQIAGLAMSGAGDIALLEAPRRRSEQPNSGTAVNKLEVWVQVVRAASDAEPRRVSSVSVSPTTWLEVYDVSFPFEGGPRSITCSAPVDVYNWTADSWRTIPVELDPKGSPVCAKSALVGDEYDGGIVRVRTSVVRIGKAPEPPRSKSSFEASSASGGPRRLRPWVRLACELPPLSQCK